MKIDEARKELYEYPKLKKRIDILTEQEEEIQERYMSAGGQKLTGMPACHGKARDLSDYIEAIEDINQKKQRLIEKTLCIEKNLANMKNDTYAELINLRYKKELCWAEVGTLMNRSTSGVKNMNLLALLEYSKS